MVRNKKAQMKIQQMAFMLIAVTLFFVLAGMFFLRISFSELQGSAELVEEKNALLLVSKLANSPEFSCENAFGGVKINCVDGDKIMALKTNIDKYSGFWGVSGIEIRKIYPFEELVECTSLNYPDCTYIRILSGGGSVSAQNLGVGVSNFVALCRIDGTENLIQERCELAKIIVYYGGEE